jgi:5-methylcytosine-specific restriction endonuclease McrA
MAEKRHCLYCGGPFVAKKSQIDAGCGHFCSHRCSYAAKGHQHLSSPENLQRAVAARRASVAKHGTKHKRGPENPSWRGGPEASRRRKVVHDVAYTREYRKRNPQMMREAKQKRRGLGRLPRGTVNRIGQAQKWKCAALCGASIAQKYHVDHITALARGGKHEPGNIQLLCPTCNLRKNAKDPIAFMQERGFLL